MTAAAPRITVVLITHNGAGLIEQALHTVLDQTLASLEVVVVDDGSTDDTADRARAVGAADPRVRGVSQANGGPARARNRGIREARGKYVAFLDHDDRWIRLARAYPFATRRETLVGYTRSPSGLSSLPERMAAAGEQVLARACSRDGTIDERRLRFLRARDSFGIACLCLFDARAADAWRYLRRSARLTAAPMLRSPRRWAIVGAIALLTLLPRPAYEAVLGLACRGFFGLRAGTRFEGLERLDVY